MTRIASVILAGGRGERLGGVDKALLEIGGMRMIDYAMAVARPHGPIIVAAGARTLSLPDTRIVADLATPYGGPLAGLAAAVAALEADAPELVFCLPVDTPLFPADFVTRAAPLLARADAAIAAFGAQDYPTNGLWRFARLRELPARLRAGTAPHSLKRLAAEIGALRLDYAGLVADDPFVNANTPENLSDLRARVAAPR